MNYENRYESSQTETFFSNNNTSNVQCISSSFTVIQNKMESSTEKDRLINPVSNHASYSVSKSTSDSDLESSTTGTVKGLTVFTCAMFIIAEMAGSGILALPKAVAEAGWTGAGLLVFCCFLSLYCGIILGKCWMLIRERNPRYKGHVRDPYPIIGSEAFGKTGKIVVEFCVLVTLIGVCVVFLLLSSQQISSLINTNIGSFTPKTEFRLWVLICGFVLLPFTWLATPKDIWPFAVAASSCTMLACILIVIRTSMHIYQHGAQVVNDKTEVTAKSLFTAFGTIAFSFGGATLFPTFQTDMKVPSKFPYAALLSFIGVLTMYIPVSVLPYIAFGSKVDDDILTTLKNLPGNGKAFVTTAEAAITFHLLFTFVITINPISQQIEEYLKLKHEFGIKRIMVRTSVVILCIVIAEAIPSFGAILSFVGGSTVTMMAFILPCFFYLRLKENVPFYIKVLHVEIICVAIFFGIAAMYSAATHFTNPFKS